MLWAAAAVVWLYTLSLSLALLSLCIILDHKRILVLQCSTQLAGRHEDFVCEQKVAHTGSCRGTNTQSAKQPKEYDVFNHSFNRETGTRPGDACRLPPMASFPFESSFIVSSRCSRIFSGVPDMTVYLNRGRQRRGCSVHGCTNKEAN